MQIRTIDWKNNRVRIIDQTRLPLEFVKVDINNVQAMWKAIKTLQVRGAPALGAAAALGLYLGIKDCRLHTWEGFNKKLKAVAKYIGSSRPTARNLFWGIEKVLDCALANKNQTVKKIKKSIFAQAQMIMRQDQFACRQIGKFGAKLLGNKTRVLTICNAGILATIDYGTALGVIYAACAQGKKIKVYSCETRPLLQGARLTAWELNRQGVEVEMIADNTAATLMQQGKIDIVIAGADRIAANGDAANKIGTLNLAILSAYHKIPFFIAAPKSTFDLKIKSGKNIEIEMRAESEVKNILSKAVAPDKVRALNPAFDVTPALLISSFITDFGIIRKPYLKNFKKTLA